MADIFGKQVAVFRIGKNTTIRLPVENDIDDWFSVVGELQQFAISIGAHFDYVEDAEAEH